MAELVFGEPVSAQIDTNFLLEINGIEYEVDEGGYLRHLADWTREVAEAMASQDSVELEHEHWEVILFLREYYLEFRIAPAMRILKHKVGERFGPDKATTRYLYELFPLGPAKQACRYAGLPKPTGCV